MGIVKEMFPPTPELGFRRRRETGVFFVEGWGEGDGMGEEGDGEEKVVYGDEDKGEKEVHEGGREGVEELVDEEEYDFQSSEVGVARAVELVRVRSGDVVRVEVGDAGSSLVSWTDVCKVFGMR